MGELISLGTAFCWTITVIAFEYAGKRVGSLSVNMIRLWFGFLFITIFLLFTTGMLLPLDATNHIWTWMLLSGFIGFVIGDLFLFQAFVDVGGRISLVIYSVVPPLTAVISYIFLGEVLSLLDIVGMSITIGAILYVVLQRKENTTHPYAMRGVIFATIAAVAQAVGLIFSKIGMGDYNAFAATQIRLIAAIIGFTIIISVRNDWVNIKLALGNKNALKYIIIGSIFGPFLGVSSSLLALQYTQIGVATTISQMNVILIIPFSIFLFKEKVHIKEIIGAVVALLGVVLLFI